MLNLEDDSSDAFSAFLWSRKNTSFCIPCTWGYFETVSWSTSFGYNIVLRESDTRLVTPTRRNLPDEVGYVRPHPALYVNLCHRELSVGQAFHERSIELVQLLTLCAVHG